MINLSSSDQEYNFLISFPTFSDLEKAAAILKGKKVADNVRVMVVPATQKIFLQCIQKGLAEIFVEAGCAFSKSDKRPFVQDPITT